MTTVDRCALTELYVNQCAHCRGIPDPVWLRLGRWIHAAYEGRCMECDTFISVGDRIRVCGDGYLCRECGGA